MPPLYLRTSFSNKKFRNLNKSHCLNPQHFSNLKIIRKAAHDYTVTACLVRGTKVPVYQIFQKQIYRATNGHPAAMARAMADVILITFGNFPVILNRISVLNPHTTCTNLHFLMAKSCLFLEIIKLRVFYVPILCFTKLGPLLNSIGANWERFQRMSYDYG